MIHCQKKEKRLLHEDATSLCHSLWQSDFTCKQVVNRLKIPQGLSTLFFRRWSEVPSRGGVRGDSPLEKRPALHVQGRHVVSHSLWQGEFTGVRNQAPGPPQTPSTGLRHPSSNYCHNWLRHGSPKLAAN